MSEEVSVKFTCKECGGTVLELPDDYTEDSIASCKSCGIEFGRWGDIKAKAVDTVRDDVTRQFRDIFKKNGWK